MSNSCASMNGRGTAYPTGRPSAAPKTRATAGIVTTATRLEDAVSVTDNAVDARAR